MLERNDVEKCS